MHSAGPEGAWHPECASHKAGRLGDLLLRSCIPERGAWCQTCMRQHLTGQGTFCNLNCHRTSWHTNGDATLVPPTLLLCSGMHMVLNARRRLKQGAVSEGAVLHLDSNVVTRSLQLLFCLNDLFDLGGTCDFDLITAVPLLQVQEPRLIHGRQLPAVTSLLQQTTLKPLQDL